LAEVAPVQRRIDQIDALLAPYIEIKQQLTATRKQLKELSRALLQVLREKRDQLSAEECRELVLDLSRDGLEQVLRRSIEEHRQEVRAAVENLWNKYGVSLRVIQAGRDEAVVRLEGFLKELGYE
jgi:type I restriction enzyme M protein